MKKLITVLTLVAMSASAGCSWFTSETKAAETAAVDCAKQDLGQTVEAVGMSLLLTVSSIIFNGGANWQSDLTALAAKYGADAVTCAASIAETLFKQPTPDAGVGPSTSDSISTPSDRAHQWVVGSGITIK